MMRPEDNGERVWFVERDGRAYARLTRPSYVDTYREAWQVEPLVEAESERTFLFSKEFWDDRKVTFREPLTGVTVTDAVAVDTTPTNASPLAVVRGLSASRARGAPPMLATAFGATLGVILLSFHWTVAMSFGRMFNEFGNSTETLPPFTRIALSPWCPLSLGLVVLGLAVAGARPKRWLPAAHVASITLGLVGLACLVCGLYLPIFDLAGKIRSGD
jgi:hypothetical protein